MSPRDNVRLFLFDIDGTLLRGGTVVHAEAFAHAYGQVYGLQLDLSGVEKAGRTDTWLLAEPLRRAGIDDATIWEAMPRAFEVMCDYVDARLDDLRHCVLPGVEQVLDAVASHDGVLGLLTGNLQRIAYAKLHRAGLGQYFHTGGFGEESEVRSNLVPVALEHARHYTGGTIHPEETVLIGDTPLDIEAGRTHGLVTVGVATGPFTVHDLNESGADLALASLAEEEAVRLLPALTSGQVTPRAER